MRNALVHSITHLKISVKYFINFHKKNEKKILNKYFRSFKLNHASRINSPSISGMKKKYTILMNCTQKFFSLCHEMYFLLIYLFSHKAIDLSPSKHIRANSRKVLCNFKNDLDGCLVIFTTTNCLMFNSLLFYYYFQFHLQLFAFSYS